MVDDPNNPDGKKKAIILKPNNSLKEMVGSILSVDRILNDEVIKEAEIKMAQNIDVERNNYFIDSVMEVTKLKKICANLRSGEGDKEDHLNKMRNVALTIKNSAGLFGYDLAVKFATSLYSLSLKLDEINEDALIVIESYVDSLEVIFSKHITAEDTELTYDLAQVYQTIKEEADKL